MHNKTAKTILSAWNGMNIYRGCTHGCIYCDARSSCYQMKHEFEDVEIKVNAPDLLERALAGKRHRCMIGTGAMSDPYQHIEKELCLTRKCLELIDRYGFGLAIQTKSDLILRDLDLLKSINRNAKCVVQMTLTTYDEGLCHILEPSVCTTARRVEVLNIMQDAGIPTIVWLTPVLPFINDTEENIRGILRCCEKAGVYGIMTFGIGLTLRDGDRQYYYRKLDEHFPGLKEKYILTYGDSYELPVPDSSYLMRILQEECKAHHIVCDPDLLFAYMRTTGEKTVPGQLELF